MSNGCLHKSCFKGLWRRFKENLLSTLSLIHRTYLKQVYTKRAVVVPEHTKFWHQYIYNVWFKGLFNGMTSRLKKSNTIENDWYTNLNEWFTKAFHHERQAGQDVTIPKYTRGENKDSMPMQSIKSYSSIQKDINTNNNLQWTINVVHLLSVSDSLLSWMTSRVLRYWLHHQEFKM